jgi:hypothetical protein
MSTLLKLPTPGSVPPLENGDRLTRAEFERRYAAMRVHAVLHQGLASPAHAEFVARLNPPSAT